jgi:hypothetical protein
VLPGAERAADQPVGRRHHEMERRLFLLEARQPAPEGRGVVAHHAPEDLEVAERDGREHVVPRSPLHQQRHHVAAGFREAGGPADHIHLVQVAHALGVRPRVEQRPHRLERPAARREMERQRVVAGLARMGIRAPFEQQPHRLGVAHRQVQSGHSGGGARPGQARRTVEHLPQRRHVPRGASGEEPLVGTGHGAGQRLAGLSGASERGGPTRRAAIVRWARSQVVPPSVERSAVQEKASGRMS